MEASGLGNKQFNKFLKKTSPNFEPINIKYFVISKHKFTFYIIPSNGISTP
jgi:hypothetical protein